MGHAFDLDADAGLVHVVEHPVGGPHGLQARSVGVFFAQPDVDHALVEAHAVAPGAEGQHLEPHLLSALLEIDVEPRRDRDAITGRQTRIGVEVDPLGGAALLVAEDRRGHEGQGLALGVGRDHRRAIEPGDVDAAGAELRMIQDRRQVAAIGGAPLDHDLGVRERGREPRTRRLPGVADGDDLGDQGVEGRGHDASRDDAGVDAQARAEGRVEARHPPGRRQEAGRRILGAQAHLHGCACSNRMRC